MCSLGSEWFFKESNAFIQQGCVKLFESDNIDLQVVTKMCFLFFKCCSFYSSRNPEKKVSTLFSTLMLIISNDLGILESEY